MNVYRSKPAEIFSDSSCYVRERLRRRLSWLAIVTTSELNTPEVSASLLKRLITSVAKTINFMDISNLHKSLDTVISKII